MITGSELLQDLEAVKRKANIIETTYTNNIIWTEVNNKLNDIISLIKKDMRMYGYK